MSDGEVVLTAVLLIVLGVIFSYALSGSGGDNDDGFGY